MISPDDMTIPIKNNILEHMSKNKLEPIVERKLCLTCFRPETACFCKFLKPMETNTRFVFLMHPKEARRSQIGTGRLSHLALTNSSLIVDTDFDENTSFLQEYKNENYHQVLLYPGENSQLIDNLKESNFLEQKPLLIFIIDGTWPCAKKMMKNTKLLHKLPRISFTAQQSSQFLLKQQPAPTCLSTIECTYTLLEQLRLINLEDQNLTHKQLINVLSKLVNYHIECAKDPTRSHHHTPSKPYQALLTKRPLTNWKKRNLIYKVNSSPS